MGYIHNTKEQLIEGKLRCSELKAYLEKIRAPPCVWLSEDGSGIIQKAAYDVKSNQLVGLVLPIDKCTGIPIHSTYTAKSLSDIEKHMKNRLSSLVYVIIAQPVRAKAPPFVLELFGTDNKFTATDVKNRWIHNVNELKKLVAYAWSSA